MMALLLGVEVTTSAFSISTLPQLPTWTTEDFIKAHKAVRESGKFNFEGCRIPIPTVIRYDRIKEALGKDITAKEQRVIDLLKYGMPINCKNNYGVQKLQKNHSQRLVLRKQLMIIYQKMCSLKLC